MNLDSNWIRFFNLGFLFVLDSSGLDNDNAESGIGTATPPKEQVSFSSNLFLQIENISNKTHAIKFKCGVAIVKFSFKFKSAVYTLNLTQNRILFRKIGVS